MTPEEKRLLHIQIGENIKYARNAAGLRQDDLAEKIGISRVSIVNIEKGRQAPPIHVLFEMAKVLKVPVNMIFPDSLEKENLSVFRMIVTEPLPSYVNKAGLINFMNDSNL